MVEDDGSFHFRKQGLGLSLFSSHRVTHESHQEAVSSHRVTNVLLLLSMVGKTPPAPGMKANVACLLS